MREDITEEDMVALVIKMEMVEVALILQKQLVHYRLLGQLQMYILLQGVEAQAEWIRLGLEGEELLEPIKL